MAIYLARRVFCTRLQLIFQRASPISGGSGSERDAKQEREVGVVHACI
jgi:hypothetical protein